MLKLLGICRNAQVAILLIVVLFQGQPGGGYRRIYIDIAHILAIGGFRHARRYQWDDVVSAGATHHERNLIAVAIEGEGARVALVVMGMAG